MNGVVDGEEDNPFLESSVNFVSTQMQGRLEELHNESMVQDAQMAKLSQLDRFRLFNTSLISGVDAKPKLRKKAAVLKPNKKSISITNLMKEKYSKETQSQESKDKLTQFTICLFYSGKKGKVSEIMKRIEREERSDGSSIKPDEGIPKSELQELEVIELDDNDKLTYSKREWNLILKKIKVKFPNLSTKTKRSLQNVSRQINRQMSALPSGTDNEEGGMWSQLAGTPTPEELNIEDIRWLYNLSDEQVRLLGTTAGSAHRSSFSEDSGVFEDGPFVTTLSQVMEPLLERKPSVPREDNIAEETDEDDESKDDKIEDEKDEEEDEDWEEVPNSSPEFSPIRVRSVASSPKLEVQESIYQKEPISSHQRESMFSWDTLSLPLHEMQEKQVELVNTSSSPSKHISEPEEIFSSSVTQTPQKNKKTFEPIEVEEIVSSPIRPTEVFKTPVKKTKIPINPNPQSSPTKSVGQVDMIQSPLQLHQEQADSPIAPQQQISPSSSSVYSTALTNFARTETSLAIPKKRYHTSIVEILGEIELIEDIPENSENVKIRKIGTRIEPPIDSEDEIADSEEESKPNTSISIIEISREIVNNEDLQKGNTSIMQVPSSPRNQFGAILDSDFLKSDEHEFREASEGKAEAEAEEFDTFSKMTATQLKESFIKLGLKPVKGKVKMVQVLNELSQHVDLSQKEVDSEDFQRNINNKINERIQGNGYWYEKVLSFEPIILSDLQKWLEEDGGILLDSDILERYCDIMGITTKVKPLKPLEGKGSVKRRRRKVD